ncbi:unnamed protein product [Macrosiphum euphorbiae]|uniref:Retrotransposon gag domain-containing protein n=1 Tax=Macrosiphum euphorbiae TaxID=13131 RepID=A0AAV0Y712_9HEMI|nr:unnamed protein product [Macrosiphum euphorbiae]
MDDNKDQSEPKAPDYLDLYNTVTELREKLRLLEASATSNNQPPTSNLPTLASTTSNVPVMTPSVDYRILPDVSTSIWTFTGHETSAQADDWISSVDGLAQVNHWPLRYRLQYVRAHVTEAARSWFLLEVFEDWDYFVQRFRRTFVRTLRKADLWRELEARIQAMNEPTIDYYYAKIGLCRSLSLSFAETRDYILEGLR